MRKTSLIDDVSLEDDEYKGQPILFYNWQIRKMLRLARVGPKDTLYDLGCGWGQNLLVALEDFRVAKAVGIEEDRERHHVAARRLERHGFPPTRGKVIPEDFDKVLEGRVKEADPSEATVMLYRLSTDPQILKKITRCLKRGSRLVYDYDCLFPEIMPNRVSLPFFVSIVPFRKPRSQNEWLSAVLQRRTSSTTQRPNIAELWDELTHDYDVGKIGDRIWDYRRRLLRTIRI